MKTILRACALWLVGLSMGVAQAATITYFHNDLAGSPVAATNASGQVIWRESYRPYGERLTNAAASSGNKIWFTSRRQDVESGLVYVGARYYDPVAGRFMSTDPLQFQESNFHSFNRYAYANNNPYKYVDPDGRSPLDTGFAVVDSGKLLGAHIAYAVGVMTGDGALQTTAVEGMRETRLDAGISIGAIFLPISSGMLKGAARSAEEVIAYSKLTKTLASEAQMAERGSVIAGPGAKVAFRDAERVAAEHGGAAGDWAKKSSSSFKAEDGTQISTHWVENTSTGGRVEFKTIITP